MSLCFRGRMTRRPVAFALLSGTVLATTPVFAQNATWTNGGSDNFNSSANWTPATVPTGKATFAAGGQTTPTVNNGTTLQQILFANNAQSYILTNDAQLTLTGLGGTAIDNQSGISQRLDNFGTLILAGNVLGGTGSLTIDNQVGSLKFTGAGGVDSHVVVETQAGFASASPSFTITTFNVATSFADNSHADGALLTSIGGAATSAADAADATATGGDATLSFGDNSHADDATLQVQGGGATATGGNTTGDATSTGGSGSLKFNDLAHADRSDISNSGGAAFAVGGSGTSGLATTVGGKSTITFNNDSHADHATIDNTGGSATVISANGHSGNPAGDGGSSALASATGGDANIVFNNRTHADGATITNKAGAVGAIGGTGGDGGTTVGGTVGGALASGGAANLSFYDSSHADGATIHNGEGTVIASGGTGGAGGDAGGGAGGSAGSLPGAATVTLNNSSHISGATITNRGQNANATGGTGGKGGTLLATGGTGGIATAYGSNAAFTLNDDATLGTGTSFTNRGGDGTATGGKGGQADLGDGGVGGGGNAIGGDATLTFNGHSSASDAVITNQAGAAIATGGDGGKGAASDGGLGGKGSAIAGRAIITFNGNATAGSATITNLAAAPSTIAFGTDGQPGASGGSGGHSGVAQITFTRSDIEFNDNATGGSAHIVNNGGDVDFNDNSIFGTAAAGGALLENQGRVAFVDSASLGNGTIISGISNSIGSTDFGDSATAGSGKITVGTNGTVSFRDSSSAGTATITNNGSLIFLDSADASTARITDNGTLIAATTSVLGIGSLSGTGTLGNLSGIKVGGLGLDDTFSGVISSSGALTKVGTGTLTLTGANSYTGGTTISGGTLQIGNGGITGAITGNVLDNANLTFNRSDDISYGGVISGTGTLTKLGAGKLTLVSANSYAGGTTITAGILQIGNGGTTGSITGNVLDNANLTFNRSDDISYGGVISGTGTMTKLGAGKLTLVGANTYTGITTITAGILDIGNGGTTGSIAGDIVDNAALQFNRSNDITYGGAISGSGSLTKLGAGKLTLTGAATHTGGTTIAAGTLEIGNGGTTGSVAGNITDNAALIFNRSNDVTYGGVISGNGTVTKLGAGTLTMTGNSSYTGATAVNAGALRAANSGALGTSAGGTTVASGAALELQGGITIADALALSGTGISNGGALRNLSGFNTISGNITLGAATRINGDGNTTNDVLDLTGTVTGGGSALTVGGSGRVQFQNAIGGLASLTYDGTGILFLGGTNTFTGPLTISSGFLQTLGGASIADSVAVTINGTWQMGASETIGSMQGSGSVVLGAAGVPTTLTLGGDGSSTTFSGPVSDGAAAGALVKTGGGAFTLTGTNIYSGGTTISAGTLAIGNGGTTGSVAGNITDNAALQFNRSNDMTYGGVISGSGTLTKLGAGTLILTGNNTYNGATAVNAGTLQLDGKIASNTTVGAAGTLRGAGTITGSLLNNGIVFPGTTAAPIATLTVSGSLTNGANGIVKTALDGTGGSGRIVAGSASLGGTLQPIVAANAVLLMQTDYHVIQGTGGRTGTFTTLDESQLASDFDGTLSYTATEALLRIRRTTTHFGETSGLTGNQDGIGDGLDQAVHDGNPLVYGDYLNLYNTLLQAGGNLAADLNNLSGDALTNVPVAAQGAALRFGDRLADHTWSNSSNLWGTVAYGNQHARGDGNGPGFRSDGVEFQLGFASSLGENTRAGVSVGYADNDLHIFNRAAKGKVRTFSIGGRLRQDFDHFYLAGQATYSWHKVDTTRSLLMGGSAGARFHAHSWSGSAEAGFVARTGDFNIEPFASIRHIATSTNGYSENGPVGALDVDARTFTSTRVGAGVRLINRDKEAQLKPFVQLTYERELDDRRAVLDNSLQGLPIYTVASTRLGRSIFGAQAGLEAQLGHNFSLFGAASGQWRSHDRNLTANGGFRYKF